MQEPCGYLDSRINSSPAGRLERPFVPDLERNVGNPIYRGAEDGSHYPRGSGSYGSPTAFGRIVPRERLHRRPPPLP